MVHSPVKVIKAHFRFGYNDDVDFIDDDHQHLPPSTTKTITPSQVVMMASNNQAPTIVKMSDNNQILSKKKKFKLKSSSTKSHKINNNTNNSNQCTKSSLYKINLLLLIGLICSIAALISHFCLPKYLENTILQEFILDPESASYPRWQKSNIPIFSSYYLFNITNSDELFKPGVKPVLQQVGPFVFKQIFEKINITWNHQNGTVQYKQIKRWIPVPSKTNGSLDDEIVHINVALLSAIHQVRSAPEDEKYLVMESLNSMIDAFKITIFMKHKVRYLLFEGYDDDILSTASSFYPDEVSQTKFGFLYQKNNTSTDGLFRIHTGQLNFGKQLGLLDTWNNENVNTKWKIGDKCRSFNHTTTGDLQPPFFLQKKLDLLNFLEQDKNIPEPLPTIRMFIADMCRTFELKFKENVDDSRPKAYRYQMDPNTFNYDLEENRCFCNTTCPPNGLFYFGVCAQDSPMFTSSPHFLFADQSLKDAVIGMQPNESQHQFIMEFDRYFGIATNVEVKFQLNILVKKSKEIEIMSDWPDDLHLYLPQFWFITHALVDETISNQLYFISEILPIILFAFTILVAFVALICFVYLIMYLLVFHLMSWTLNNETKYESVSMLETKSNGQDLS